MDKKSERARVLKERNALSTAKRGELNHALCSFLSDFLDSVKVQTIGAFLPIGSEPDISEVLKNWLRAGAARQVFLPVTEGITLRFAFWDPAKPLMIGRFSVPEPTSDLFSEPPLLLVPCVALNKQGYRLGYGAGYYDRYLPRCRNAVALGVAFEAQRVPEAAADGRDRQLDGFVTERKVYRGTDEFEL